MSRSHRSSRARILAGDRLCRRVPGFLSYLLYNRGVELAGANAAGHFAHLMPIFGSGSRLSSGERFAGYHSPAPRSSPSDWCWKDGATPLTIERGGGAGHAGTAMPFTAGRAPMASYQRLTLAKAARSMRCHLRRAAQG